MQPWNDDLRRQVRAIDGEQRRTLTGMRETLDRLWSSDDATDAQRADAALGGIHRRRFITLGGATVLSAAFLAACGVKHKSAGSDTPTTVAPTTEKDINILRAASSLEEVAVAVYQKAIDSGLVKTPAIADAAKAFQAHHKDHSQLFRNATSTAGGQPYTQPNPVLMQQLVTPRLAGIKTEADIVKLAYDLERMAASTYQANVSTFDNITFNQTVMSVGGIESRHVAFLAPLVGKETTPDGPFQAIQGALSPSTV